MFHGDAVKINLKNLNPSSEVSSLLTVFHFSSIPLFHASGRKPSLLKATCIQYVIEILKRLLFLHQPGPDGK